MSDDFRIPDALAEAYAAAIHALARADHEIGHEESQAVEQLLARRTSVAVDAEALFFSPPTPESFAAAVRKDPAAKDVGRALIADAIELSTSDGDLKGKEATAILRYARALGMTGADVSGVSPLLDQWLHQLG